MIRYLLDTGAAGDFINRRLGVYDRARAETANGNRIGVAIPVLAELAYGVEWSASRDRNMQRLRTCSVENPWRAGAVSLILALSAVGCTTGEARTPLAGIGRN